MTQSIVVEDAGTLESLSWEERREVIRNILALTGDFVFFSIGFAFYDPVVVVPAFVKTFTGSSFLVGAFSALRTLMVTLPQLWAASMLAALPRKKPLLIWSSLLGRAPILLVALAVHLWADQYLPLVMAMLGLGVVMFYISEGLNGISWPALVGQVIPSRIRGRFFGLGQLLSSFGAAGAGYLVNRILAQSRWPATTRWAVLFAAAFVGLMLSAACMFFIREEPEEKETEKADLRHSLRMLRCYLREDRRLRRVVAVQLVGNTAAATFAFFVVRASAVLGGGDEQIGVFLAIQSAGTAAAALLGGYLVDHVGSWAAIRLALAMEVGALAAVTLAGWLPSPLLLYGLAFFMLGFVNGSFWWSFNAYLLDVADEERRPIYLATNGVLSIVLIFNPMIVGALFDVLPAESIFAGAWVLSVGGLALAWSLRRGWQRSDT